MSNYWATADRVAFVENLNLGAGVETVVYAPGKPIHVKRIVLVMTAAQATAAATVTVGVRNVDDSSSTTAGTFATPAVMAVNDAFYVELGKSDADGETAEVVSQDIPGASTVLFTSEPGILEVNPGQEMFFTSDGGGDTGAANVYIEYSEQGQDIYAMTEIVFTPA